MKPPPAPSRDSPFVELIPRRTRIIMAVIEAVVYVVGYGLLIYAISTAQ